MSEASTTTVYGRQIRRLRDARKWSQEDLARRAHIGKQAMSDIESGRTKRPHIDSLQRIAKALDVPVGDLLGEPKKVAG